MDKSKIYLDLSKCIGEELKNIYTILGDTLKFESPSIVFNFPIMHYHEGMWLRTNFFQDKAKEDNFLEDKTELTYPEFIKLFNEDTCPKCRTKDFEKCHSIRCPMRKEELFEGGERKEVLQVENNGWIKIENTDQRYPDQDVWVCSSHVNGNVLLHHAFGYISRYFTHYQPIIKPLPPKF